MTINELQSFHSETAPKTLIKCSPLTARRCQFTIVQSDIALLSMID